MEMKCSSGSRGAKTSASDSCSQLSHQHQSSSNRSATAKPSLGYAPTRYPSSVSSKRYPTIVSSRLTRRGTKLKYKPGILIGGKGLVHDCGVSRAIGWFLEPLLVLGLFGKKGLTIRLKGITNGGDDPSVDTFKSTTLTVLRKFGVSGEGLELKVESRGVMPLGGGEVVLSVPMVHSSLTAVNWVDAGRIKRIRGLSFLCRVSVQFENKMIHSARGNFNRLLPNVHIFTDHKASTQAGNSPCYGMSLVAETNSGCFISADSTVSRERREDEMDFDDEKEELASPEDVGERLACVLLGEIEQGGVVDSTHRALLFLLCALCPQDISKVRVGKLSPYGIESLRLIKEFLGVTFDIKPDPHTGSVILKCMGCGLKNFSRKIS